MDSDLPVEKCGSLFSVLCVNEMIRNYSLLQDNHLQVSGDMEEQPGRLQLSERPLPEVVVLPDDQAVTSDVL